MDTKEGHLGKILVVDDDTEIGNILGTAAEAEGYTPIVCNHPEDALSVSKREKFGLAFVDINMPEMSGLELASRLMEHDPRREVVIMTGYSTHESAVEAIKLGASDYLRKPFTIHDFSLCLKRFQEREALRKEVRLAEQRYFQLVQNIPLLIFVIRRGFVLDFINDACSVMLGFTPHEAMNTPNWFLNRIHPNDRERVEKLFQSAFNLQSDFFSAECRLIHKRGQTINTIVKSIQHLETRDGTDIDKLEGIIVDITDRVFLEKALVQKEKLKTLGSITAEVAHEIRNPLVSIGGFARRLAKKFPDMQEGTLIVNEARRLEKILDRIGDYLRPVEVRPQACSVNTVLTYCLDLLSPEITRYQVECKLDLEDELSIVHIDPDVLTEVFVNLIRNALMAMPGGGDLSIRTFESDQSVHIDFRNRVGRSKTKDPEELFLPFDEGGDSIGLPLCYKLLRNMGGLLSYGNEQGYMTFTVSLPKGKDRLLG